MLYCGTHTSLYKTLSPEAVLILEDAILKSRLRLYDAAEQVFDNQLSLYSHIPIVAIEHAETLLHRYKCFRILEVLAKVPKIVSLNEEEHDVQRLIALFLGVVRLQTEGVYKPALDEVERVQRDWASKPVDEYNDIQVECIRKYRIACIFLGASSNFVEDEMKLIPCPNSTSTPPAHWQGLTDLRISLVSQGRFMEALRFSTTERSAGTTLDDYQTTCLLLQLVQDHRAQVINTKDEIPWRIAMTGFKLDLGKLFASLGAQPQAEVWLNNLEREIEETVTLVNGSTRTLQPSESLDMQTIELARLKMVAKEEPTQSRFERLLALGQKMQTASHIETESSHYLAITWAEKLFPPAEFAAIRTDIQLRTQVLFETQGRVPAAMTNLTDILTPRSTVLSEIAKSIEMLEQFEQRYPDITLPTVKSMFIIMEDMMRAHAGQHLYFDRSPPANDLLSSLPTGYDIGREVSITEPNQQSLEVKDILDRKGVENRDFDMGYKFFSQPEEVVTPRFLHELVSQDAALGVLTDHALFQLFGLGENNRTFTAEDILKLEERELLQNLVGSYKFPLHATNWAKRRPTLKAWLLDESRPKYRIRQCLWVALHNSRSKAWSLHFLLNPGRKEYTKVQAPTLVKLACMDKTMKTVSPSAVEVTSEHINAIEERLDLEEARMGFSNNHYERESRIVRSILSQLYMNLFFYCRIPGEELGDACIEFFARAEEIARDQLAHWRTLNNSQYFAQAATYLANIAQFRIEYGIIKEAVAISQTVEETLELLEEVELLFGTTLYDIDLGRSLQFLNMKTHIGNGMQIWKVGKIAIRLLQLAIATTATEAEDEKIEQTRIQRERWLLQLWQWVQRVKARTLAQSMGLDNMVPDNMLIEIQNSFNEERASVEKGLVDSANQIGLGEETELGKRLEAIKLEEASAPPLELLSEVRQLLKERKVIVPNLDLGKIHGEGPYNHRKYDIKVDRNAVMEEISALSQDLQHAVTISEKIKNLDDNEGENEGKLREELSDISKMVTMKPALHKLLIIADFLNREEVLQNNIDSAPDRYQHRVELQRLRKDMRHEPVLERMLRIREGRPVSNQDLHKIAASRQGKVVFVDWFTITLVDHIPRIYMLLWRNGVCKGIDLQTKYRAQLAAVEDFFADKDLFLPDVLPTAFKDMDLEKLAPKADKPEDDLRPVVNCFELVKPLFEDPLIEPGDLLVLSLTEGFHNFPLHAIQEDKKGGNGPLILHHPVVYVPSLSVLHKCFWARHVANAGHTSRKVEKLQALVLGGIDSPKPVFQYGVKAVGKIGGILNSLKTTFVGDNATLDNFQRNISSSDLLHIHLHTNYGKEKQTKKAETGHLSQDDAEDVTFVNSPLNQAIVFNGAESDNKLTARQIIELQLSKGAHFNLMACSSGRQGKFQAEFSKQYQEERITDEVMGLVPAFLFSGAGSVTSTLWPIMDEHGAVFSNIFFRELTQEKEKASASLDFARSEMSWIDLAEIHQKAVLEMKRIYKQPSAWAGFVISGCWTFQI
ncbi:uncharacterized protein PAC_17270 [Phialocephala subalpina]|uniref:CHAT domain-containing protein n=1 Tax=Phialocephala subalpina TaxID=576137 RepID=A0A1L7XQN9_9HELO|nr:uncharacterized protein PAC_17270 [Phialocephala subalpina]